MPMYLQHLNTKNGKHLKNFKNLKNMLTKILLPHKFQMIGWILFFPLAILLVLNGFYDYEINWLTWDNFRSGDILNTSNENFTNEILRLFK